VGGNSLPFPESLSGFSSPIFLPLHPEKVGRGKGRCVSFPSFQPLSAAVSSSFRRESKEKIEDSGCSSSQNFPLLFLFSQAQRLGVEGEKVGDFLLFFFSTHGYLSFFSLFFSE